MPGFFRVPKAGSEDRHWPAISPWGRTPPTFPLPTWRGGPVSQSSIPLGSKGRRKTFWHKYRLARETAFTKHLSRWNLSTWCYEMLPRKWKAPESLKEWQLTARMLHRSLEHSLELHSIYLFCSMLFFTVKKEPLFRARWFCVAIYCYGLEQCFVITCVILSELGRMGVFAILWGECRK